MKGTNAEKLRIGKPNDNKLRLGPDSTKVEKLTTLKPQTKSPKTKTFPGTDTKPPPVKNSTLKGKLSDESIAKNFSKVNKGFSTATQNGGASEGKSENPRPSEKKKDYKRKPPLSEASKENVSEKIKKNRSWDHVGTVSSKTTLAKRVSDVLQQVRQQKPSSELDLFRGKLKVPQEKKTQLSDIFNSFSSKPGSQYPKFTQNFSGGQSTPEKSMSFDSLKFLNRSKQLCKCLSLENDHNRIAAAPLGVFNVRKKSFISAAEKCDSRTKIVEPSQWRVSDKPWEKSIDITAEILSGRSRSPHIKSSAKTPIKKISEFQQKASFPPASELRWYQDFLSNQNEETAYESLESLLVSGKLAGPSDLPRKANDRPYQESAREKETVQICQCLHFHTEEGFKKLALHNHPTKEYGSKFFRVNYYPRERDELEEEMENRVELVDKETTTENEPESEEPKNLKQAYFAQEASWKAPLEKKISTRLKTIGKKQEKTKRKEIAGESASQFYLWRNGSQKQIPRQPKKNEVTAVQKGIKETKTNKGAEVKEKKKPDQPLKRSDEFFNVDINQKKALEELDALEKLFTKLNSVELSLKKRKVTGKHKPIGKDSEDKSEVSSKKNKAALSSPRFFADNEAEEEYQRRRRKLKSAIIRHMQNWLKLDFSDI